MPATGLKIVGTVACLPWCSISSSFQNSLKTCGHRGYEFLEFWCWNLVPFLPDIGFQLLKSLWSSFFFFFFFVINNLFFCFFHKQHNIISKIKQNKTADTYSTSQGSIKREGEREGQQEHKSYSFK